MQVVLFEPEIPPNTGNIARLCAALEIRLNLVEPLGFSLSDKYLKRAGLDYWPHVDLKVWPDWDSFASQAVGRMVLTSARGGFACHEFQFEADDNLVFGPETRGLPDWFGDRYENKVRIPITGQVRSINLSTATGIVLHEGLRQTGLLGR